jgi:hypothetical protein
MLNLEDGYSSFRDFNLAESGFFLCFSKKQSAGVNRFLGTTHDSSFNWNLPDGQVEDFGTGVGKELIERDRLGRKRSFGCDWGQLLCVGKDGG